MLKANPSSPGGTSNAILTATVTAGGRPVTTGSVTFNGYSLNDPPVALNAAGTASWTAQGTLYGDLYNVPASSSFTATYSGTESFGLSAGTVQVTWSDKQCPIVFSPAPGTYTRPTTVTITATPCVITNAGGSQSVSTETFAVATTQTLTVTAGATGYDNATATATYTIPAVSTPAFNPPAGSYSSTQVVSISDSTTGAALYYTTNGTTPTAASTLYTAPFKVSASETLKAIGVATSLQNSPVAAGAYLIQAPTTTVVTSSANPTTDGSSVTFTAKIAENGSKAIPAGNVDWSMTYAGSTYDFGTQPLSTAGTSTYTFVPTPFENPGYYAGGATFTASYAGNGTLAPSYASFNETWVTPTCATPVFSPVAGTYKGSVTVTITTSDPNCIVVLAASATPVYAPIVITSSQTLTVFAIAPDEPMGQYNVSPNVSATYTIVPNQVATPVFSPVAGTYTAAQTVTISDRTPGATLYYTTDGTAPTNASTKYTGAVSVSSSETLKAIASASGYTQSQVAAAAYAIEKPAATPTFSVSSGTYKAAFSVTLSDTTAGAVIYYTTNGTTPTASSPKYTSPIAIPATPALIETVKAIAIAPGYTVSTVATEVYTMLPAAAVPTFAPAAGIYTSAQAVTIKSSTVGAAIYYTTNGASPTTSSTKYNGAITVSTTSTLKAIAVLAGYSQSGVASAAYTITPAVATPTFSPAAGTYTSAQTVQIASTTIGSTVYYTTDGTAPTTASNKYSAALQVSRTQMLKAIAVLVGDAASAVATAVYTIGK